MQPISFLSLVAFVSVALQVAASPQDALNHLATLKSQVQTLNNAFGTMPNNGIIQSLATNLAIYRNSLDIQSTMDEIIQDVERTSTPVPEADASAVLNAIRDMKPDVQSSVAAFVAKQPAVERGVGFLGLTGIREYVKQRLDTFVAFEDAIIKVAPTELSSEAEALRAEYDEVFASAIDAYRLRM